MLNYSAELGQPAEQSHFGVCRPMEQANRCAMTKKREIRVTLEWDSVDCYSPPVFSLKNSGPSIQDVGRLSAEEE